MNTWFNIFSYLTASLDDKNNSIFYFRCLELNKHIGIIHFQLLSGLYHQSIRELRYLLESIIQAYCIDRNYPNSNISDKLNFLNEIDKITGSRLIKKSGLKHGRDLKRIYFKLSKHIHSTHEKLMPVYENSEFHENISYKFNSRMFEKCKSFNDITMDAIYFITLAYDYNTAEKVKSDSDLIESIQLNDYKLTLKFLE